jgi:tRNA(fMet)-specific endonuclease VapC
MKYLLDTNICIETIRGNALIQSRLRRYTDLAISSIVLAELRHGVEMSQARDKSERALTQFLTGVEVLPFDDLAACYYGKIRADLQRKGQLIGNMDILIASHALALDVTLVTNNVGEFSRVEGLAWEDWMVR